MIPKKKTIKCSSEVRFRIYTEIPHDGLDGHALAVYGPYDAEGNKINEFRRTDGDDAGVNGRAYGRPRKEY
jgi:hypothetical protein